MHRSGPHLCATPVLVFLLLLAAGAALTGCASIPPNQVAENIAPLTPGRELREEELLNISIQVFEPGALPEDPEERRGLAPEIRDAEARFAPIHLKHTLQRTGYWGAVRVVPDNDVNAEVLVRGAIVLSDGESMVLRIEAVDAREVVWFRRTYAETAQPFEFFNTEPETNDTFQDLFNAVANDLARYKSTLTAADISEIRQTSTLKYARLMAPDAFAGYLTRTETGELLPQRLPARGDPMLERVTAIRTRDDMLVDTINDYYDMYYTDLWEPYSNWRKYRQEEVAALRRLEREALSRQVLGVAAIAGAIALGVATDSETSARTGSLQQALLLGGAYSLHSGFQKQQEGDINKSAIEELGASFESEAQPLVLEVEGKAVRLTGSAEQQYTAWRGMLRQIYAEETGLLPPPEQQNPAPEHAAAP